jgi:hypothetical protein
LNARPTLIRAAAVAGIAAVGLATAATTADAAAPVDPTFTLAVPTTVHAGADATDFYGHLSAPDGAHNIWVSTDITGVDADDVHLEWKGDGAWNPMPVTPIENGVRVTFGDGDLDHDGKGFSAPAGATADTAFRIAVDHDATHGSLHWVASLLTGDDGTLVNSTSGDIAVSADPKFTLSVPTTLTTGAGATEFTGHLSAPDAATNIWLSTDIIGADADDVTVEWKNGDTWEPMPATKIDGGVRVTFGDGDLDHDGKGFSVPAGYAADTQFRIAVADGAQPGTLSWTSNLVTGDAGTLLSSTTGTVAVDVPVAGRATLTTPAAPVTFGRTIRLAGTLVDTNHGGVALAGQAVTVFKQVAGSDPVAIGEATTDADGAFRVETRSDRTASYWVESGDVTSKVVTVHAAKSISAVAVSRHHATPGQKVSFNGVVATPETKQLVVLQVRKAGHWVALAEGSAGRLGAVKISSKLPRGERVYRLVVAASPGVAGTVSKQLHVTVK